MNTEPSTEQTAEIRLSDLSTSLHVAAGFERDEVPRVDIDDMMGEECGALAKQHGSYEKALENYLSQDRFLLPSDFRTVRNQLLSSRSNDRC